MILRLIKQEKYSFFECENTYLWENYLFWVAFLRKDSLAAVPNGMIFIYKIIKGTLDFDKV